MKFPIVTLEGNLQEKLKKILLLALVFYMMVGAVSLSLNNGLNELIVIVPEIVLFLALVFVPVFCKRYKIIGELVLKDNKMKIVVGDDLKEYQIKKGDRLTLYYRGAKGDSFEYASLGVGILGLKDGSGNILRYESQETEENINFFVDSSSKKLFWKVWFRELKKTGVNCEVKKEDYRQSKMKEEQQEFFKAKLKRMMRK